MRLRGRERLGFYPLPILEAGRIRRFLRFPAHCSALDPCIGEGGAFAEVTNEARVTRYGIELEAQRALLARSSADEIIHGNCFDVQCPVESFSLLYLNPPIPELLTVRPPSRQPVRYPRPLPRWNRSFVRLHDVKTFPKANLPSSKTAMGIGVQSTVFRYKHIKKTGGGKSNGHSRINA